MIASGSNVLLLKSIMCVLFWVKFVKTNKTNLGKNFQVQYLNVCALFFNSFGNGIGL